MKPTAIILAAGEGRRMGGPKALLRVGGVSLIASHVERFFESGCGEVIAVVPTMLAQTVQTMVPRAKVIGATTQSQAESLMVGVAASTAEVLWVTPVDTLPALASTCAAMVAALTEGLDAVTPQFGGHGGHPVLIRRASVSGQIVSLHQTLEQLGDRRARVPVDDSAVGRDFDTPAELEAVRSGSECIECWFDFGSNYSYLSVMRIEGLAAERGYSVRWRPFVLGAIFRALGWQTSPFVLQPAKGAYVWKDMERQARKYGLAWRRPSDFPRLAILPLRVALFGSEAPWVGEFCRRVMQLNFVEDHEIASKETVTQVLGALGLDAAAIIAGAESEPNKVALRDQTERARVMGVFGAPTFFVRGEMYFGNDRLDDALGG